MASLPPRISDDDYVLAYPVIALWAVLYAVFTPAILNLDVLRAANGILMGVVASAAMVCWQSVRTHTTLTIERNALWAVIGGIGWYVLLQAALSVYYAVTVGNTDRIALILFALYGLLLTNRRRRWLTKQRLQVSAIAAAHPQKEAP